MDYLSRARAVLPLQPGDVPPYGRSVPARIGLGIDAAEKRIAAQFGAALGEKYGPWDYCLNGVFFDTKSTSGRSLTLSDAEYRFALEGVSKGSSPLYGICLQRGYDLYEFVGFVPFGVLMEKGLIHESRYEVSKNLVTGRPNGPRSWFFYLQDALDNLA